MHLLPTMVSRTASLSPSKTLKRPPHKTLITLRRKKTPQTSQRSIISSINRSIRLCRRRFLNIFSELANLSTSRRIKSRFHRLRSDEEDEPGPYVLLPFQPRPKLLPPPSHCHRKTVFLDLDETLIHSIFDPPPEKFDFVVRPNIDGEIVNFYVLKRPGVDDLLDKLAKEFEVVVFTAGIKEYASLVLDKLDPLGVISHRLYRDSCRQMDEKFVKDLSVIGRELSSVVIVDDNPNAYLFQPENALPVLPFVDDPADQELQKVIEFCEFSASFDDLREAVAQFVPQR